MERIKYALATIAAILLFTFFGDKLDEGEQDYDF